MKQYYLLLALLGALVLHGMYEQSAMMDADTLKQQKWLASHAQGNTKALMLAQGIKQ